MDTVVVPEQRNLNKRMILIVEDNEINREMLKEILADDYHVIEAVDGVDGMEKLSANFRNLSLVLLDVQMPRMDGYEFLRRYRDDRLLSSVPVIVTTGSTISEDEEKCLALGASDFVTKPYNPKIILRRIEAIIRLHESIQALQAVEFDELTGLYNRSSFVHHVGNELSYGGEYDLMMLNIEDFSYINERYGERMANDLLRHIGKVIRTFSRTTLSCRYHADRFVMMRPHCDDDHAAKAAQIDALLHEGAPIPEFTIKYAAYDKIDPAVAVPLLCDRLALAVASIKHQYNQQIACYDESMSAKINRLHAIEECMEDALEKGQFKVYYQPKHDAATGELAGAEALVRWIHPELGFISPGDFIPLFEQNGFISKLDYAVYQTVCSDLRKWTDAGISPVPVSVNASRRDFLVLDSIDLLSAPLTQYGVDIKYIHVEITESLCIDNQDVCKKVEQIRDMGIHIELDDFGSGQSSLGSINDIPMNIIKLDISFARQIEKKKEIVQMIISLAHALGLRTVAEGVETEEQLQILRDFGCDMIQGYYYSKPLPEAEFREYLKTHSHLNGEVLFA